MKVIINGEPMDIAMDYMVGGVIMILIIVLAIQFVLRERWTQDVIVC
jgi:hypothetical protein